MPPIPGLLDQKPFTGTYTATVSNGTTAITTDISKGMILQESVGTGIAATPGGATFPGRTFGRPINANKAGLLAIVDPDQPDSAIDEANVVKTGTSNRTGGVLQLRGSGFVKIRCTEGVSYAIGDKIGVATATFVGLKWSPGTTNDVTKYDDIVGADAMPFAVVTAATDLSAATSPGLVPCRIIRNGSII